MRKVLSITNLFGEQIPLDRFNIHFVGENYVIGSFKNSGFVRTFGPWDGYTVVTE